MVRSAHETSPATAVLQWYGEQARDLPWRREPRTPYRVLIAEAMLQQTRAQTVAPRYEAFVQRFPDLGCLAAAPLQEVLRSWEGLGYYARARNLHRLAQELVASGAALPSERTALLRLPGVGPYVASALRSFAFGIADPPLDANLRRIALRFGGVPGDPLDAASARAAQGLLQAWFTQAPPSVLGDALMDLGAGVCTARRPACAACPLQGDCAAAASGAPEAFGVRSRKAVAPVRRILAAQLVSPQGQAWRPRPPRGLLGGLWEPPHVFGADEPPTLGDLLREVGRWGVFGCAVGTRWPMRHVFTHQVWEGEVVALVAEHPQAIAAPAQWLPPERLAEVAVPRAFRAVL